MSNDLIAFAGAQLPAYLQNKAALAYINAEVAVGANYPTMSIKGKVFTLVKDNEKKIMMSPHDPDETAQSIQIAVLRANTKSRVYYAASYEEGSSDGARPTCFSNDGVVPSNASVEKQSAKCAVCPHAVWGSKLKDDGSMGEGTECAVNTRMAVSAPDNLDIQYLLRVPAGSRKNFNDVVKAAGTRGFPYTSLVYKLSFDPTAPSPKLVFKAVGLLDEATFNRAMELHESDIVKEITGLGPEAAPRLAAPPAAEMDELDAAIATRAAVTAAKAPPAAASAPAVAKVAPKPAAAPVAAPAAVVAKVAPKVKPAAAAPVQLEEIGELVDAAEAAAPVAVAPAPTPKPAPATVVMDGLLDELTDLLGSTDD